MRARLFVGLLAAVAGCGFDNADDPYKLRKVDIDVYEAEQLGLWAQVKPSCTAYHYERIQFEGSGTVTIQIADDRPLWRWYFSHTPQDAGTSLPTDGGASVEWVERGAAIGTHPDLPPASTVEQLWDECAMRVHSACPPTEPLQTTAQGVLTACVTSPTNAAPGCPLAGIILQNFKCGRVEPPAGLD